MTLNIRLDAIPQVIHKMICHRYVFAGFIATSTLAIGTYHVATYASDIMMEPVQACVIARDVELNAVGRSRIAQCLGWQENAPFSVCRGSYKPLTVIPLADDEIRIMANNVSFYNQGRSQLSGDVEVQQTERIVNAQTAYVYRDAKSNKVTKIELFGEVKYLEPERLMIARKATINPQDKSGQVEDVLYRFNSQRQGAILPAWGRASLIQRFANQDYRLEQATYSNCAPEDKAWQIEAETITLDKAKATGVARNAKLRVGGWPVFYTPYFSFPTSKERKSGFLMPIIGTSNVGGFDYAQPYYWNIAPNYDATLIPHVYSRRGLMMGGQFRYLTTHSYGVFNGRFLPNDHAFRNFILDNEVQYPQLRGTSTDRWSVQLKDSTQFNPHLHMGINFQQVSDPYYLQDFSSNLAILTERQLLRQGDLTYTTENWLFRGMLQSYQTLRPVNQTPIEDVYQRLPQLMARGVYDDLPLRGNFSLLGQFDYFQWPDSRLLKPEGPRYHLNPVLSFPQMKPWGFITPSVELVENYYDVKQNRTFFDRDAFPLNNSPYFLNTNAYGSNYYPYGLNYYSSYALNSNGTPLSRQFNRTIPRYSVDGGLYFERPVNVMGKMFTQTLEPRLYYLHVPFHDQTPIPVYDSGYMIFNTDQLFRTNRFSGFDRIGDANQLSYAVSSRWLSDQTGGEKATVSIGQIRYFANRRVQLCQNNMGTCVDNPLTLGYLSPLAKSSPIASRAVYRFHPAWVLTGDYVWDPYTSATNNGHLNFHYQPAKNQIVSVGYTYLVNGDITQVANSQVQDNSLHQATFAYAWPLNERWSTLGAYNYNLSKRYAMMTFLGLQYDSCCWAVRLLGGRTFQNLNTQLQPRYNNNVYLQILLKGLGSVGNSDPASTIHTYVPGYTDSFHS